MEYVVGRGVPLPIEKRSGDGAMPNMKCDRYFVPLRSVQRFVTLTFRLL